MPLLPPLVMRKSACNSKSAGAPPFQMMNVLLLMTVSGVISPTSAPSSTRQYLGSPSHPASVLPSKMGLKPGSSPVGGSGRSDCFGTYCAASRAAASAPRKTRRLLFDIVSYVISQKNRPCIICGYPYYYPSVSSRAATIFMRPPRTVAQPLRLPRPDSSGRSARFTAYRYVLLRLAFFVFCEENHQAAFFINWLVEAARAIRNAVRVTRPRSLTWYRLRPEIL